MTSYLDGGMTMACLSGKNMMKIPHTGDNLTSQHVRIVASIPTNTKSHSEGGGGESSSVSDQNPLRSAGDGTNRVKVPPPKKKQ